jgi:DNA-binding LacI/PurR family transcriptional regulator
MIDETSGRPERESALLETIAKASWVDGVLLSAIGLHGKDLAALGAALPVVLLGERTAGTALDHVAIDNATAARDAVGHLLAAGCTRIAALGGTTHRTDSTTRLRLRGYRQVLRRAGLADCVLHAPTPDYKRSRAGPAVRSLLERPHPPDGLFCLSDELAIGALRELHLAGLAVPRDVRVIGFDDVDEAAFSTPTLSSIRPDRAAIAEQALQLLITRIDGSEHAPSDVRVAHRLITRESTAQETGPERK